MSDITTINGLHSCKPGNDPVVGQVKLFVIENRKGKSGKPYIKIRSANAKNGGMPHRILQVDKTDFVDQHGNISFNLEIESSSSPPSAFQQTKAAMRDTEPIKDIEWPDPHQPCTIDAPQSTPARQQGEDGVTATQSPPRRFNGGFEALDTRQRAIIRQHSQSMALEVLKLKVTLNELTVEDLTPAKLRQLSDYFDNDVIGAAQ